MQNDLNISEIYDKNINFLIGSGASFGIFPTLSIAAKTDDGQYTTIEALATQFEKEKKEANTTALFMHYYKTCIEPVLTFKISEAKDGGKKESVIENYKRFLITLLNVLERKKAHKRCNVFTTNYDGCLTLVADDLLKNGGRNFIINDGARGFTTRFLHSMNFDSYVRQSGVFSRHSVEIPQINIIHLHGSIYWYREPSHKDDEKIEVSYSKDYSKRLISADFGKIESFSSTLENEKKRISEIPTVDIDKDEERIFWEAYNQLPIVNPRKWKFFETVFEEHYYQMLRYLSYELERKDSILISFGFSFADEHIRNLVKRSLSNPDLQIFICCFNQYELEKMRTYFEAFKNVVYLRVDDDLTFSKFNDVIFSLDKMKTKGESSKMEGVWA